MDREAAFGRTGASEGEAGEHVMRSARRGGDDGRGAHGVQRGHGRSESARTAGSSPPNRLADLPPPPVGVRRRVPARMAPGAAEPDTEHHRSRRDSVARDISVSRRPELVQHYRSARPRQAAGALVTIQERGIGAYGGPDSRPGRIGSGPTLGSPGAPSGRTVPLRDQANSSGRRLGLSQCTTTTSALVTPDAPSTCSSRSEDQPPSMSAARPPGSSTRCRWIHRSSPIALKRMTIDDCDNFRCRGPRNQRRE